MAKEIIRIGRLYMESENTDLHLMVLDFSEKDNLVHGVEARLTPKQIFELIDVFEKHVSRLVKERVCDTCVNWDGGCLLPAIQRLECNNNNKSQYVPAYPTA